jgi:hypothetical protein
MHLAGRSEDVDLAQWTLLLMFAASFYNVGTIWSPQMGWRLWPYVAPGDFRHIPWRVVEDDQASRLPCRGDCIPRITRADLVATGGSWDGANLAERWVQVATYVLTAAFWGRWHARTYYAKLTDGSLDPMYERAMSTHWIRCGDYHGQRITHAMDGN